MSDSSHDQLLDLIDAACAGRIDDAQRERLEKLLREDQEALKLFVHYRDMHASLRWLSVPAEFAEQQGVPSNSIVKAVRPLPPRNLARTIATLSAPILAASLLLGLFGFWLGTQWNPSGERLQADASTANGTVSSSDSQLSPDSESSVARITGLVDCQWDDDDRVYSFGDLLIEGDRVELASGLLQLTFNSGAKVIIQGPASFTPQTAMHAQLERGKISALISESARGYTVVTPTAEVVDLGTEFALDVTDDGSTELHVLDGDVLARRRSDDETQEDVIHVRKSDALRFANRAENVERIDAQPDKFARQITPKLSRNELPPLPVTKDLKFWVAADLLVTRDDDGFVSAWRDVCVGDNQVSNDACQFERDQQPLWVSDAGYGLPAVRFNGWSNRLVTDAFSTGDRVTAFVACVPFRDGQRKIHHGGHLLNFGGKAPTIEIALHGTDRLYTGLWAANAFGREFTTGNISTSSVVAGQPLVICYTYDAEADSARQWIDGTLQGEKSAPLHAAVNSPRTIGGHGKMEYTSGFYRGDIYEVLIYDAALQDDERASVTDYIKTRYNIDR